MSQLRRRESVCSPLSSFCSVWASPEWRMPPTPVRASFALTAGSNAQSLPETHILSHRRHGTALMDSPAQTFRQTLPSQGNDHEPFIKAAST